MILVLLSAALVGSPLSHQPRYCETSHALLGVNTIEKEVIRPAAPTSLEATLLGPPREKAVEGDLAPRPISVRGLANLRAFARVYGLLRWFYPGDAAAAADWTSVALAGIPRAERAQSASELAEAICEIFLPIAPTLQVTPGNEPSPPLTETTVTPKRSRWRHRGIGVESAGVYSSARESFTPESKSAEHVEYLPGGISIRLPLTTALAADGTTFPHATGSVLATGKPKGWMPAGFDRTTRLASTITAWNLFKHFYPYWDDVGTNWDDELGPALQHAALAPDDRAFQQELRRFVALLRDGHASVRYTPEYVTELPLDWRWVEGELVVTAVDQGAQEIASGTIVQAFDGTLVRDRLAKEMALISGSSQWQREHALQRLRVSDRKTATAELTLRAADGKLTIVSVPFETPQRYRFAASRLKVVQEIKPGVTYVDITRLSHKLFTAEANRIEKAGALIFDLRGYPEGEIGYLAHMGDHLMLSAKMETPEYNEPDGAVDRWDDGGWKVQAALPRYTKNIVFLTDASAISFSESILGTVKGNRLGVIIGEPTAGTNGNITNFLLPGGYEVSWTAMRVTNQDGTPHHIVGITPDVLVTRTIAGIREGRDEVLDAAVKYVTKRQLSAAYGRRTHSATSSLMHSIICSCQPFTSDAQVLGVPRRSGHGPGLAAWQRVSRFAHLVGHLTIGSRRRFPGPSGSHPSGPNALRQADRSLAPSHSAESTARVVVVGAGLVPRASTADAERYYPAPGVSRLYSRAEAPVQVKQGARTVRRSDFPAQSQWSEPPAWRQSGRHILDAWLGAAARETARHP